MNCVCLLSNTFQKVIKPVLTINSSVLVQQTRNTFVLKRKFDPPLREKGVKSPPKLEEKHSIYDLVKYETVKKGRPPIELILTSFVEDIGDVGDRVFIERYEAYFDYLLPGLAVYATPENIRKYDKLNETKTKIEYSSPYVPRTIKYLNHYLLHVIMSNDNKWTLEPWHVKAALRIDKIHVNDDSITLPERVITGPDPEMENKEFYVTIMINKRETANLRCRIHLWSKNERNNLVNVDQFDELSEPLYPEFKQVLDELPTPKTVAAKLKSRPRAN